MKTKAMILGVALTGLISAPVFAQVDTTKKKEKTDTVWNKEPRDTSTKRDTNQVSSNGYIRPVDKLMNSKNTALVSGLGSQSMIAADNKWYVRKQRSEEVVPTA